MDFPTSALFRDAVTMTEATTEALGDVESVPHEAETITKLAAAAARKSASEEGGIRINWKQERVRYTGFRTRAA
jgi:hypothetical protein